MNHAYEPQRRPEKSGLIRLFARHPNAANLVMAMMILVGVVGLMRLNTQFFPTISINVITVTIDWRGASAEDVADGVLEVVEPELRFLDNIDEISSTAREGGATIRLEFSENADMRKALSDVEQAVAAIDTLPQDSEPPVITKNEAYEIVGKIALSGPFEEQALKAFARRIRDALIDAGVDKVEFLGARDTDYIVEVGAEDLRRLDLTVADIAAAIGRNSEDAPSGALDGALERQVRTLAARETPATLGAAEVVSLPTGERILVRDLAPVEVEADDRGPRGLSGGLPAIELSVQRAATADTLKVSEQMRAALAAVRAELPDALVIELYQASADRVAERIGLLVKNGVSGLILVAAILYLFLDARIALWIMAGVPVSILAAIGFMFASGQTLNMISLFALIMTLGIIVDDAIVVGEETATLLEDGVAPDEAAVLGAERMGAPVLASLTTTAAAFGPILLISDVIGQIMGALPLVALAVLTASMIECFFVLPGHLAHALAPQPRRGLRILRAGLLAALLSALLLALALSAPFATSVGLGFMHAPLAALGGAGGSAFPYLLGGAAFLLFLLADQSGRRGGAGAPARGFRRTFDAGFGWVRDRVIHPLARLAVAAPYVVLAASIASFILAGGMIAGKRVGFVFFPSPEAENIVASVVFEAGLPEDRALAALAELERALDRAAARLGAAAATPGEPVDPLVKASFVVLGLGGGGAGVIGGAGSSGENLARIDVELTSSEVRRVRTPAIVAAWRAEAPKLPGVLEVAISEVRGGPPGRDLDIRLSGASPDQLKAAALDLQGVLAQYPGVSGVEDDMPYGKPELGVALTPRGATLGFTPEAIGQQIRDAVDGRVARRIADGEEEIEVRVRQRLDEGAGGLRNLLVRAPSGAFVPLDEVALLEEGQGFSVIRRRDGSATVSVTADLNAAVTSTGEVVAELQKSEVARLRSDYGVRVGFSGRAEEQQKAFGDLYIGLVVALLAIYIILAWQMGSYARPLAVMAIIPFGFVGAVVGHWVMGIPLTILSFIGLLGLSGILVNDSIILVARFVERLDAGDSFETAAAGASADRFRAVLLTSLSTVLGLAPLLFEKSLQAQFLLPMAATLVFGLGCATVFVLFLVPALLSVGRDAQSASRLFLRPVGA